MSLSLTGLSLALPWLDKRAWVQIRRNTWSPRPTRPCHHPSDDSNNGSRAMSLYRLYCVALSLDPLPANSQMNRCCRFCRPCALHSTPSLPGPPASWHLLHTRAHRLKNSMTKEEEKPACTSCVCLRTEEIHIQAIPTNRRSHRRCDTM